MNAHSDNGDDSASARPAPCPVCSKMSVKAHHPFCSDRCAKVDLGRWLGGRYVIATKLEPGAGLPVLRDDDEIDEGGA